jgi:hypothetical protein
MQRLTFVQYATKPGRADENERLSRAVFDELRARQPDGVAYALCRAGDEFFHLFLNFAGDASEPVTDLPTFKAFTENAAERQAAPPETVRRSVEVVESYGFSAALAPA